MKLDWVAVRKDFPIIPFIEFLNIKKMVGTADVDEETSDYVILLLAEGEKKELEVREATEMAIQKRLGEMDASMIHHRLEIKIPVGTDEAHLKAYLVYGLLKPSQSRIFAGGKTISFETIQNFVESKLGLLFKHDKFEAVHIWLLRNGVTTSRKGKGFALSTSERDCSKEGGIILKECRRFALNHSKK